MWNARVEMKLFDAVYLNDDLPNQGLAKGQAGVILDVYHSPTLAYEVEFCDNDGKTISCLALSPEQLSQTLD